jgi:hypothetical protein
MNSETIACAHEQCQCQVTAPLEPGIGEPGEAYCSDYCQDASSGEEQPVCACGHPQCDEP